MKHLLSKTNADVLQRLADAGALLAFDFDGTLAPIVDQRDGAVMPESTRTLLEQVCERYPCAVISGRSKRDVTARLGGVSVRHIVGNHGLEALSHPAKIDVQMAAVSEGLKGALAQLHGVEVEDKGFTLAVHYRRAANRDAAKEAIELAVAACRTPVRLMGGHHVVNVLPLHGRNKGDALFSLMELERSSLALYVGDDVTDEDVFAASLPIGAELVGVRIGQSPHSRAGYYLHEQAEVDELLRTLLERRSSPR